MVAVEVVEALLPEVEKKERRVAGGDEKKEAEEENLSAAAAARYGVEIVCRAWGSSGG